MPPRELAATARLFKALADPTRLRIVALLAHGELCVCHLERDLRLPQPTVSRHLALLKVAGVVTARRERSWVHYRLVAARAGAEPLTALARRFEGDSRLAAEVRRLRAAVGPTRCR